MSDQDKTQQVWENASSRLVCGGCKAVRLLIWEKPKGSDPPQCAHADGEHWVAVHCDYFRRRIEHSNHLSRCAAFQKRGSKAHRASDEAPTEATELIPD